MSLWRALRPEWQFTKAGEDEGMHVVCIIPPVREAKDLMG
jgi:hypothetical protein